MNSQGFRALALAKAGAVESSHMNHPDFRLGGKIFATLSGEAEEWGMVKLTPVQQKTFIDADPKTFAPASGAWGRQGCTMVRLRNARKSLVKEALQLAVENLPGSAKTGKPKSARQGTRGKTALKDQARPAVKKSHQKKTR